MLKKAGGGVLGAVNLLSISRETSSSINNINNTNSTNISKSNPTFGRVLIAGFAVAGITYIVMHIKANSLMQVAIDNYNSKQK